MDNLGIMETTLNSQDSRVTLLALGGIAGLVSAVCHEAIGHGGACLAVGGEVTLLTATHFACLGGSSLVDMAGPLANVVLAVIGAIGLVTIPRVSLQWRLFFLAIAVFNTFWFAGECVRSSLTSMDDEAAIARAFNWPFYWRPLCLGLALGIYRFGLKSFVNPIRSVGLSPSSSKARFSRMVILFLGGVSALVIAGVCWQKNPLNGGIEGALPIGVACLPILFSVKVAKRLGPIGEASTVKFSPSLIGVSILLLIIFALTQGRGIGRLA